MGIPPFDGIFPYGLLDTSSHQQMMTDNERMHDLLISQRTRQNIEAAMGQGGMSPQDIHNRARRELAAFPLRNALAGSLADYNTLKEVPVEGGCGCPVDTQVDPRDWGETLAVSLGLTVWLGAVAQLVWMVL